MSTIDNPLGLKIQENGMNQCMKKRWVEALRSGKYKQGSSFLQKSGSYCCLGVLADIETDGDWVWNEDEQAWEINERVDFLCDDLCSKAKLTDDTQYALGTLNDRGATFEEIADWIEENL